MKRFFPSLLVALLVMAPALSGCADEFVTDSAQPGAVASATAVASAAKAPGCTYSIVGDTLVLANTDHVYDIVATGAGCNGYYQDPRWRVTGNGTKIGYPGTGVEIHAADVPGGSYEVRARVFPAAGGTVFLAQNVQIASPPPVTNLTVTASSPGFGFVRLDWTPCSGTAASTTVTRTFIGAPPPGLGAVTVLSGCAANDPFLVLDSSGPYRVIYNVKEYDALGFLTGQGSSGLLWVDEGA